MSVEEAAKHLGLSPWYVRQLCNKGKIPAFKVGDYRWDIPDHIFAAFMRSRKQANASMQEIER